MSNQQRLRLVLATLCLANTLSVSDASAPVPSTIASPSDFYAQAIVPSSLWVGSTVLKSKNFDVRFVERRSISYRHRLRRVKIIRHPHATRLAWVKKIPFKKIAVFAPIAFTIGSLAHDLILPTVILESFYVPDSLKNSGYSTEVMSSKLKDGIDGIFDAANRAARHSNEGLHIIGARPGHDKGLGSTDDLLPGKFNVNPPEKDKEFEIPLIGVKASYQAVLEFLRKVLPHKKPIRFSGDAVTDRSTLQVTLRVQGGDLADDRRNFTVSSMAGSVLVDELAKRIVSEENPYAMAVYAALVDHNTAQALAYLQHYEKSPRKVLNADEKANLYSLWGNLLRGSVTGRVATDLLLLHDADSKFAKASAAAPKDGRILADWAQTYAALNEWPQAMHLFQRAAELAPRDGIIYTLWAVELIENEQRRKFSQRDYTEAVARCEMAVRLMPRSPSPVALLAVIDEDQMKWDAAEVTYRQALALDPKNAAILYSLGEFLFDRHRSSEVLPLADRAIDSSPEFAAGYILKSQALLDLDKDEEALNVLKQGLKRNPSSPSLHKYLGFYYARAHEFHRAIKALQQAVALDANDLSMRTALADNYLSVNETGQALRLYRSVIQEDPNQPAAYEGLGRILIQQNRPQEALGYLLKAIDLGDSGAYFPLDNAYLKLGRHADAYRLFEVIELEIADSEDYLRYALLFEFSRDVVDAIHIEEAGLRRFPKEIALYSAITRDLSNTGQFDRASRILKTAQRNDRDHAKDYQSLLEQVDFNKKHLIVPMGLLIPTPIFHNRALLGAS